jgi:hypothetical protein
MDFTGNLHRPDTEPATSLIAMCFSSCIHRVAPQPVDCELNFPKCGLTLSITGGAERRPLHAVIGTLDGCVIGKFVIPSAVQPVTASSQAGDDPRGRLSPSLPR